MSTLRDFFTWLIGRAPKFKCTECEDTGWASYDDRIGTKTYHVFDHCRACRKRTKP